MSTPTQGSQLQSKVPRCQPHPACPAVGPLALTQQGWMTGSRIRRVASLRLPPEVVAPMGARAGLLQHLLASKGLPCGGHHAACQSWGLQHVCRQLPGWVSAVRAGYGGQVRGHQHPVRGIVTVACVTGWWPQCWVQPPFTPAFLPVEKRKLRHRGPTAFPRSHTLGVGFTFRARPASQPPLWPLPVLTVTGQQGASPCGPGAASPQALSGELGSWLLSPVQFGGHPGEAPQSRAFRRDGGCER